MFNLKRTFGNLSAVLALAACGGSATTPTVYQSFIGTDVSSSTVGGDAIKNGQVAQLSGSYQHDTGATKVSDGSYTLNDANGFDANDTLTDGVSTIRADAVNFTGTYDFARPFTQTNAGGFDVLGIVGLATASQDIPSSNTVEFVGEAVGVLATNTQGIDMTNGTSQVFANFSTDKVTVTLSDFTMIDQLSGATITGPLDEINITNMTISSNGFQFGTATTRLEGTVVDVLGNSPQRSASGTFFGINADGTQPAEVGGAILLQGDDGQINGLFIAAAN